MFQRVISLSILQCETAHFCQEKNLSRECSCSDDLPEVSETGTACEAREAREAWLMASAGTRLEALLAGPLLKSTLLIMSWSLFAFIISSQSLLFCKYKN